MRSATPTESKPFSRNKFVAASTTRARFSAACSLVMRNDGLLLRRLTMMTLIIIVDIDDGYHHSTIRSSGGGDGRDVGADAFSKVRRLGHSLRLGDRRRDLLRQSGDGRRDGP